MLAFCMNCTKDQLHWGICSVPLHRPVLARSKATSIHGCFSTEVWILSTFKAVDRDSIWSALEAAGDKPVVLDMYSKWCGPCRMIYPKLVKLSDKYTDVVFLKLDCTSENKTVFSNLGVGILPTFKIFQNRRLVSEVKGAKYDELVFKIEKMRSSSYSPLI